MKQPKLTIKQYRGNGLTDWALFRADQGKPIIHGITKNHANHLKRICSHIADLPTVIKPIPDWYDHDEIIDVK